MPVSLMLDFIPNSKRLLVILGMMLMGIILLNYGLWQYNQNRLEERDRLIKKVSEQIKGLQRKEPANHKDLQT